jgi:hypothetical protein
MKVVTSEIIYDNKIFDKTIDFMKVLISKIIYDNKNFNKTIDFMKVLISKINLMIIFLIKLLIL